MIKEIFMYIVFSQLKETNDPQKKDEIEALAKDLANAVNATKAIKKSITVVYYGL